MKLTILVVLIAATFAQKVAKAHPSCKLAISKNGRCGKAFGNTRCAGGFCSKWNWCGTSALHKKTHQAMYDARKCPAAKKPSPKKPAVKPTKKVGACALKVSKNGRCGKAFGNTRCGAKGVFCSKWNWCGTSALHKRTHQAKYDGRNCGKRVVKKTLKLKIKVKAPKAKKVVKKAKKVVKKAKKAKKAKKVVKKAKKVMKKKIAKKAKKAVKKAKKVVKKAKKVAKKAKKVVK